MTRKLIVIILLTSMFLSSQTLDAHPFSGLQTQKQENGNISQGYLNSNGRLTGIWKTYDPSGRLIKEIEYVTIGNDTWKLKEIQFHNGHPKIVFEKPWFTQFYLKNLLIICIILGLSFFLRIFINSSIYNSENGTNFSPIYLFVGPFVSGNFGHSLMCTFNFWWTRKKLKHENKTIAGLSNSLSVIALGLFFGLIAGLILSGELK